MRRARDHADEKPPPRMDRRTSCLRCGRRGYAEYCRDCREADPVYFAGRGGGCASVSIEPLGREPMDARAWREELKARGAAEREFYTWASRWHRKFIARTSANAAIADAIGEDQAAADLAALDVTRRELVPDPTQEPTP